jgi:hypothetical protein
LTNIVSGSSTTSLTLGQTTQAGAGGDGNGANGGNGASATSSLTANNPGGGQLDASANALSGTGGNTYGTGTPGNSGDTNATVTATNLNNRATAYAAATSGNAGLNGSNNNRGTRGTATATAHATTSGSFLTTATATVSGRNAVATAIADTSSGIISSMSLSSVAHPTDSPNNFQIRAYGSVGGSFESFPGNTAAHSIALPTASDITNNLFGNPNSTAAYNSPNGKTPLGLVALNLQSGGNDPTLTTTISTSASYSIDVTTLQSGKLLVELLDPINSETFTSLHFSITREGAVVENQTFTTSAAATTYFNDRVLDLGALKSNVTGTLDLTFALDMTTLDNGARYGTDFLVADVGLVAGVPGDYNNNGVVDAGDYVLWRKFNNTATTLPNDSTPGTNASDYTVWRAHFGQPPGSGASFGASVAVPEPAASALTLLLATVMGSRRLSTRVAILEI